MLLIALWLQADSEGAMGALQDMNNSLGPYIVGKNVGYTIYDSVMVAVFLTVITIVRYFVGRSRQTKA
jgi:hypothetical protein